MQISLIAERKYGLDVYIIKYNGSIIHTFMSKEVATTRYIRLKHKLGLK